MVGGGGEWGGGREGLRGAGGGSLGESKAPVLGTARVELNLLSGTAPIPPASAEKPYFYRAKVAAASQSNDLAVRIRLLQGAASIEPNVEDIKLQLFDADYRAKRYRTAIAALMPVTGRSGVT